ncbi:MAG: glycosyltransferase family 1 protein [Burkholderiales bacterium]
MNSSSSSSALQRPRIGVDFHTYDGKFQGSRSHLLGLYREAITLAPEIDFVFFLAEPDKLAREQPAFRAANVTLVPMTRRNALARLAWQLPWQLRLQRLDLLHMQYRLPIGPGRWAGRYACTIHDLLFESHPQYFPSTFRRLLHWTGLTAVQRSELLFTVSHFTRGEMARLYGVAPERIALTANGVDTARFRPGADGAGLVRAHGLVPGGYLCTVGRIEPRKNHLTLLRAYAQMPQPRLPLLIIGQHDPEFGRVAVRQEVERLGLDDDVRFLETVSDQELPALLRHARLFVYPSLAEGFGMPVLEAMASGVAVVTANTTSLPEVAGDAALTVNPHDATELAAAMLCLLADPQRRQALVRRGLMQAQRYSWRAAAQALVQAYRQHFAAQAAPGLARPIAGV